VGKRDGPTARRYLIVHLGPTNWSFCIRPDEVKIDGTYGTRTCVRKTGYLISRAVSNHLDGRLTLSGTRPAYHHVIVIYIIHIGYEVSLASSHPPGIITINAHPRLCEIATMPCQMPAMQSNLTMLPPCHAVICWGRRGQCRATVEIGNPRITAHTLAKAQLVTQAPA